jgi:hypothetical protein
MDMVNVQIAVTTLMNAAEVRIAKTGIMKLIITRIVIEY